MRRYNIITATIFVITVTLISLLNSEVISQDKLAEKEATLIALLPTDDEITGWKTSQNFGFFEPQNLWNYINGQAEMYLDYGFKLVLTTEYMSVAGSRSLMVEIYHMQSPEHAFGIYAAERSIDDSYIKIGGGGYYGDSFLNFWKGAYYVKLTSFQISPDTKEVFFKLAEAIAGKIGGTYSEPELFAYFPEKNRVKMSERFIPKNFLGLPFLRNGYRVEYMNGEDSYQVFLAKNDSQEEANEAFRKYLDFFESEHEEFTPLEKEGYHLIYTKREGVKVIFQFNSFVGGVLNNDNLSEGEAIVEQLVHKLRTECPQP